MAEIKSTLDIIMERAKAFTVTEADKSAFRLKELTDRVQGLVQRYLDRVLDAERLGQELESLGRPDPAALHRVLLRACVGRVRPEADVEGLLEVLDQAGGVSGHFIRERVRHFQQMLAHARQERAAEMRAALRARGIAGSAVVPNVDSDPGWAAFVRDENERFQAEMAAVIAEL